MKIAIASMGDPRSVKSWSGIPVHIVLALEHLGHEVIGICLNRPRKEPWYFNWKRRIHHRLQKRWFLAEVDETWLKIVCKQLDDEVAKVQPDVVITIHGDWLAYTSFSQPSCIIHDTTFASIVNYYPEFTNLTLSSIRSGNEMYSLSLKKARAAVFSAEWASESAIKFYNTPKDKVHTIPFGANLVKVPLAKDVDTWICQRASSDVCKLLFLGVNWERKGGLDTLRFVAELNRKGIKSTLAIVGCSPVIPKEYEYFTTQIGYLRKDDKLEAELLETLLLESSVLILPSVAECYGCVYCEANAYGLPVIGRDTGGVPEIIKDGVNGLLMKNAEMPEALAWQWVEIWSNRTLYINLSRGARHEYDTRLNYNVFAERLESVLENIIR